MSNRGELWDVLVDFENTLWRLGFVHYDTEDEWRIDKMHEYMREYGAIDV